MEIRQAEIERQVPFARAIEKLKSRANDFKQAKLAKEIEKFTSGDAARKAFCRLMLKGGRTISSNK
jgi:hypothetical protein